MVSTYMPHRHQLQARVLALWSVGAGHTRPVPGRMRPSRVGPHSVEVLFTRDEYGPIMLICCWAKGCKEPMYLVTNMDAAEEACRL